MFLCTIMKEGEMNLKSQLSIAGMIKIVQNKNKNSNTFPVSIKYKYLQQSMISLIFKQILVLH